MEKYSFDNLTPRRGSGCYKWDASLPGGVVLSAEQKERVIPLWVADMDFSAAPFIVDALRRRVEHGIFGYTQIPPSYYESVIGWFRTRHSLEIDREWILYTSGVVPAISATLKALANPGDGVIVMTPVYNCFFSSIRNNSLRMIDSPLLHTPLPDGRFTYRIDFEDLERKCALPDAKILLLCNPHNPAGRVWSEEELSRVGDIARMHSVIVVSDEIHCELVLGGGKYVPFARTGRENLEGSVTLSSPSKSFNTAGLQIANIFCWNAEWRQKIDRAININEVCDVNPFGVVALEASYSKDGEIWLEELNRTIEKNYRMLLDIFRKDLPTLPVCLLEGTYLAWIDVSSIGLGSDDIEEELLRGEQVWINSGSMYGKDHFIRINLATSAALLKEGLQRVVKGLTRLGA